MRSRRKLIIAGGLAAIVLITLVVWHRGRESAGSAATGSAAADEQAAIGERGAVTRPARPGVRIAGVVVTDDGTPVRGASVRLGSPYGRSAVTSDDGGRFDLGVQPAETYLVTARMAGRTGAVAEVDLRDPTLHADQLRLVLYPCEASLHGTVRDAGGGVVPGAQVLDVADLENGSSAAGVLAGADGTYELCVPPGNALVVARADGYAAVFDTVAAFGKTRRDFTLSPGASIAGRVVRAGGEPVPGALVEVYPGTERTGLPSHAVSDEQGRFAVPDLPPGTVELYATAPGLSTEQPCTSIAEVGGTGPEVVCELAPTLTIAGKVLERGAPVPGVYVTVTPADVGGNVEHMSSAVTQADGSFVIEHVFPDEYRPSVGEIAQVFAPIKVETKDVTGIVLSLERGATISGRVVHGGKPVAGASVQLRNGGRSTITDEGGAFAFDHLAARTYQLYAESHRVGAFTNGPSIALGAGEQRTGIDIALDLEGSIEGVVVDQNDRPVGGVFLSFSLLGGSDFGLATTADDGTFAARSLSGGGEYTLEVRDRASGGMLLPPATGKRFPRFAVSDGKTHVTGVRIKIRWERLAIAGRVTDAAGQPVPDVTVEAVSTNQVWMRGASATSDQSGAFAIRDLTAGAYNVRARSTRGAAFLPGVAAGKSDVAVRLEGTATIQGTLVGFTSPPEVFAHNKELMQRLRATVIGTTFRIADVPAGEYIILASSRGGSAYERVVVTAGATAKVTITNPGVGNIDGVLLDRDSGQPITGAHCWVQSMIPSHGGMPTTDADGTFHIVDAPAGERELSCWSNTHHATVAVEVARGAAVRVELRAVRIDAFPEAGDAGMSLQDRGGVMVSAVKRGGAAARAGVAVGDVVKSLDGRDADMLGAVGSLRMIELGGRGAKVKLVLERGDKEIAAELTLDPRTSP